MTSRSINLSTNYLINFNFAFWPGELSQWVKDLLCKLEYQSSDTLEPM